MANQIKMATSASIVELYERGWSKRRIARELGLDRETVARHIGLCQAAGSKPAIPPAGIAGRASACRPHHAFVLRGIDAGLSAQRIFQDLRVEQGFTGGYDAVKRYVRRLTAGTAAAVERVECQPGEEAQVDFGLGAPIIDADGRRRRSWVFRIVLSHSRKGYSEAVFRQDTESFIRCMENAFRYFGGVPRTLVIDNLRAAVSRADWYEPDLTPKMVAFCRHYGSVVLPTRPRHPEHKGKVERGVGYVKGNALKARVFASLAEENAYLRRWEEQVADQRVHGTTRQHVGEAFEARERGALQPLAQTLFPCYEEGRRLVHRDSHVELKRAYYKVPEEYVSREVWVRWDAGMVRIFNQRMDPIAVHARLQPGRFSQGATYRAGGGVAQTADYWCQRAGQIGPWAGEWAQRVHARRGPESIRVLMGLWQLGRRSGKAALDKVCRHALDAGGSLRLRDLRRLLDGDPEPVQQTFFERHPLIRDPGEYGALVAASAHPPELPTTAPAGFEGPSGAAVDNSSALACAGAGHPTPTTKETR